MGDAKVSVQSGLNLPYTLSPQKSRLHTQKHMLPFEILKFFLKFFLSLEFFIFFF